MNPLVPNAFEGIAMVVALLGSAYMLTTFVVLVLDRTAKGWAFLLWTIAILGLPLVGATAWWIVRRRTMTRTI